MKIKQIADDSRYDRIKNDLKEHGIDGLAISGSYNTGSVIVAPALQGIPCIHVPKTMDLYR